MISRRRFFGTLFASVAAARFTPRREAGLRWFTRGAFRPRGVDSVPAMLTPGECVISAKGMARLTREHMVVLQVDWNRVIESALPSRRIHIYD